MVLVLVNECFSGVIWIGGYPVFWRAASSLEHCGARGRSLSSLLSDLGLLG